MKKIFLENLPKKHGVGINKNKLVINWGASIGYKLLFVYNDIKGEVEIVDYIANKQKLVIQYNNNITEITTGNFQKVGFGSLIGKITKDFKIEINKIIQESKRKLIIVDREYRKKFNKNEKYYKYHCNKCGNEDWINENNLLKGKGCNVCAGKKVKLGINTIWDTDRWMVDLGISEEDAKKYTHSSHEKINAICPDCRREKSIALSTIYTYKSIGCICSDGKSYPEKFIVNLLNQLGVIFTIQYSPDWIKPKRYDFYIPKLNCIIETHGKQHYSNINNFKTVGGRALEQEQKNDKFKRETALANEIKHYIELDCSESNMKYIKNSILNSEVSKLFDLSKVDWLKAAEFANKNIVKEVCDYWNNKSEDETTSDLTRVFGLDKSTIIEYLKKGNKLDWCNYNPKEEMSKRGFKYGKSSAKRVEIFKDGLSLGIFTPCSELEKQSEERFGVKLLSSKISNVCNGKRKQYKGYTFRYVDNKESLEVTS